MTETLAVIGGGQLARMMIPPAVELDINMRILVEAPTSSAAQVSTRSHVGTPKDLAAMREVTAGAQVVTFEHEHIPADILAQLDPKVAIHPSAQALKYAQDKGAMRAALSSLGVPLPRWQMAHTVAQVQQFGDEGGWPIIMKTPTGGYDGKGVAVIHRAEEATDWLENAPVLLEEKVEFDRELAVLLARSPSGEVAHWPVVETQQEDGICAQVNAPAPGLDDALAKQAQEVGTTIARELNVTGVLAVEMFQVGDTVLVNELAMRPHNSGHWTIEGAQTSQFEQHLRAVLDLPLGPTDALPGAWVMRNLLGCQGNDPTVGRAAALREVPQARIHLYGKEVRPGRKLGHVTVGAAEISQAQQLARRACDLLYKAATVPYSSEDTKDQPYDDKAEGTGENGRN